MKKYLSAFSMLAVFLFSLTSCEVHFGEWRADVPWWWIALPIEAVAVAVLLLVWYFEGKAIARKRYVCGSCGNVFTPKGRFAAFSVHCGEERVFRCPKCGRKDFCTVFREPKDSE